jgi:hypothetical protein
VLVLGKGRRAPRHSPQHLAVYEVVRRELTRRSLRVRRRAPRSNAAAQCADRIALLKGRRIVAQGTVEEVMTYRLPPPGSLRADIPSASTSQMGRGVGLAERARGTESMAGGPLIPDLDLPRPTHL